jgi:hypothetical protein
VLIDEFTEKFVTKFREDFITAGVRDMRAAARQIAMAIRRNLGIAQVSDHVGMGSFGFAARISVSDWMLKLTTDESEVRASASIKGLALPNVARIFDAVFVGGFPPGLTIGVVITERMDMLGTGDPVYDRLLDGVVDGLRAQHDLDFHVPAERRRYMLERASKSLVERIRAMGNYRLDEIANGIEQLRGRGVFVLDTHSGNVGSVGDGPLKLFDLGLSSSPKQTVPHIAEPTSNEAMAAETHPEFPYLVIYTVREPGPERLYSLVALLKRDYGAEWENVYETTGLGSVADATRSQQFLVDELGSRFKPARIEFEHGEPPKGSRRIGTS